MEFYLSTGEDNPPGEKQYSERNWIIIPIQISCVGD
jgi:hypothetical protein